ncbi:MAG: 2-oxoacid:acceptor oxidoreductase subunit alpha [Chloroflexota bacterium]|nr:2-oxoacid:acceptor oxidoreductase subunit alpha [Chloroflexota bacterium]
MAQRDDLVIRVAGEAGEGVLSTGQILTLAAARAGYAVLTDSVPPAEIKGGHSLFQIRLAPRRLRARGDVVDILLAFNQEAYDRNIKELRDGGLLIYDSGELTPPENTGRYQQHALPLTEIAKKELQFELGKNVVAVGALAALFGLDPEHIRQLLHQRFARKGEDILNKNYAALDAGIGYVERNIPGRGGLQVRPGAPSDQPRIVVAGNQAIAMGSIAGGCRVYAGYPITPATDIMEFLAAELPKVGGAVVQAEDEMSALGMAIGASYAGKKAMTATSGPGFSLMVELMGLAGMAEIPVVVVDAQRAGPSTGMPTRQEQGDLFLAATGGHGEIQRIVLAPVSVADCFTQAVNAFNLAEQFQMPVALLTDTILAVRTESIPAPDLSKLEIVDRATHTSGNGAGSNGAGGPDVESGYRRYQLTESGISPMAIPGTEGGQYVATGLEHNEAGRPRSDASNHRAMTDKRFQKMELARRAAPPAHAYGDPEADIGILCWGSTFGMVVEAIERLAEKGIRAAALAPRMVWPLPDQQLEPFLKSKRVILVPEMNYSGQFAALLRARYLCDIRSVTEYSGAAFEVSRLVQEIQGVVQHAR